MREMETGNRKENLEENYKLVNGIKICTLPNGIKPDIDFRGRLYYKPSLGNITNKYYNIKQ